MAKVGRKTKRNPQLEQELITVLTGGATVKDACAYVGIHQDTFYDWCNKFVEFSEAVSKARSSARVEAIALIRKSARGGNWQAAAWLLERTDPANFGRQTRLIIEGGLDVALINQTIKALQDGGIDPAAAFEALISEAQANKVSE